MTAAGEDVGPLRPHAPGLAYEPAIDGLRAVAVMAVLLYHGGVSWASGGYLGVDVFFVLSGFLITSLLVAEWSKSGRISIGGFYARRARRLFPALAVVLVAVAAYIVWVAPRSELATLRGDELATIGYVANWRLVLADRGYFAAFASPSPLTHTWSLAVEEQWYLLWPVVMIALLRMGKGLRVALGVTVAFGAASAIWMAVLAHPGTDPSRVYYGTDTRAQELLAGAALALVMAMVGRRLLPRASIVAGVPALLALFVLFEVVDDRTSWLYEGGLVLVSGLVLLVVVAAVQPSGLVRRGLAARPLVAVGLISYGLYLWHLPVYVVGTSDRLHLTGTPLLLARLAITFGLAFASYHLLERPIREGRVTIRAAFVVAPVALAAVLALFFLPVPKPRGAVAAPAGADVVQSHANDFFVYDPSRNPVPTTIVGDPATRIVMTGDSTALTLSDGFVQRTGDPPVLLWDQSIVGCALFAGNRTFASVDTDGGTQCAPWRADRDRWLQQFDPEVVAVLSGVWETYDKVVDGRTLAFGSPEYDAWFATQLDGLVAQVSAGGARVALLTAPCNQRPEALSGDKLPEDQPARIDHLNDLYRAAAARHPDAAAVVDLHEHVCPRGAYAADLDGVALRADDGVHFTPAGADEIRRWLYPQLVALAH
jgi:peptidoglycan/LPS O-acetylase OafA/YrhL